MNKNKIKKTEIINALKEQFKAYQNFYVTDTQSLTVAQISALRRSCFDKQIKFKVAKNTLIRKAIEDLGNDQLKPLIDSLHGVTALMMSNNPKEPALIISSFREKNPKAKEKPTLKMALVGGEVYLGDEQLKTLKALKTKQELIGEVIGMLQSPLRNIISGLTREDRPHPSQGTTEAAAS